MAAEARNWHHDVFFGIHYDLHANAQDTELGRALTAEHLRERLLRTRPDWIQCDCKGHPGYTSWPTKVGSTSPGVVRDALRVHRDVTRELGIRLGMHYSGVIDSRALELHPEWGVVDAKGERKGRATCRLSAYGDELLIPQMLELVREYDVDGFWVDGENWGSQPCWCALCRAEFSRRTGIGEVPTAAGQPHWERWLAFQRDLFREYVTRYAEAVHACKPDCLVCSNWMYTIRQPEPMTVPVDYLSGDYTPNWGAARAALEARMLDNRGATWDLMVWGFTRNYQMPQSPWAMKPALHLKQEVAEVVALGGAVMVYAKPHRDGWLTCWENDIIAEVGDFCRARREACFRSVSESETAVLHLADHYYSGNDPLFNYGNAVQPLEGALCVLLENHLSTDIVTVENLPARLPHLKLLVVPEQTRLGRDCAERLDAWVRAGGCLLLSGAHLVGEVPDLVGCAAAGEATERTLQLPVGNEAVQLAGTWQGVVPAWGTETWLLGLRHLEPTDIEPDLVVGTCRPLGCGKVLAVHGPLFRNYFCLQVPRLRRLVAELIERLRIPWTVRVEAPHRLELVCRRQNGSLMLSLINRGAGETLSPTRTMVGELLPIPNVAVRVAMPVPPAGVTLLPDGAALDWTFADGILAIRVPEVRIHDIVAIRPQGPAGGVPLER
ncbi:MAG: alpha-L-fucosidase [Lentisphaeria bacterium]|nr:alpha-L-fucosidase [Lentisphaeria bacterium]